MEKILPTQTQPQREYRENVIDWYTGDDHFTCTFTQKKFINKVLKIRDKQPSLVPVFIENSDGSIYAHLPLKALKLYLKTSDNEGVEDDGFEEPEQLEIEL